MANEEHKDSDTLLKEMKERAESEREQVLTEAREKRDQLLQQADSRIETMRQEAKDRLSSELRAEHDRILGLSRMEKRNEQLAVRRRHVNAAFERAEEKLNSMQSSASYGKLLRTLAQEALEEIHTNDVTLSVSDKDKGEGEKIAKELELKGGVDSAGSDPGTVILTTADGLRRVDNSISTRLRLAQRELVTDVAQALFSGGDNG